MKSFQEIVISKFPNAKEQDWYKPIMDAYNESFPPGPTSLPPSSRLWEEVPVSELPEKETEKYSIDVPTILDNSLYGWGYYDFENKHWIGRGSEGKIVSWLRPLIGNPEVGEKETD